VGVVLLAIGTSLPELVVIVVAAKRGEHQLALGNVIGSNLFNTLAVVGIAGSIHPLQVGPEILYRDCLLMGLLTFALFFVGFGVAGQRRINRVEGFVLLLIYLGYTGYLASKVLGFI